MPPELIPSLEIDVWVDPYSAAQRIAVQEHGRARLNDPLDPLDQRTYLEQYIGEEHAEQTLSRHRQWRLEQARFEREVAQARSGDQASACAEDGQPPPSTSSPGSAPAAPAITASTARAPVSPASGHLRPLGRLTTIGDERVPTT